VGTPKRDRQKSNRQYRLEELAKQARRKRSKRLALRLGIGIPLAVLFLIGLVYVTRSDNSSTAATTTVVTTAPASTVPPTTIPGVAITGDTPCPPAEGPAERAASFEKAPPMCIDPAKTYTAVVTTSKGAYTIALDAAAAPQTVNNFVVLARYHFFDGVPCHRIIAGFMVQCGDPSGVGSGGPGYTIPDELPTGTSAYPKGTVAMANTGAANTGGSQFFTVTGDGASSLPSTYSVFGHVTDGLDTTLPALDALADPAADNGIPPKEPVTITSVTITES
jgi:cyclophilin family peptidyl-prolyl cis-trans isomerase